MTTQENSIPKEILVASIMILVEGSLLLAGFFIFDTWVEYAIQFYVFIY
jgi:hypothetical protein